MTINVHSYESMGTFDGPGLRLVVFLQGCNFRCLYCANPDTIAGKGGTPTPPEEIVRMAMSQRPFFGKRGGVTFSGGEPTFQAKALVPLMRELKEKGISPAGYTLFCLIIILEFTCRGMISSFWRCPSDNLVNPVHVLPLRQEYVWRCRR